MKTKRATPAAARALTWVFFSASWRCLARESPETKKKTRPPRATATKPAKRSGLAVTRRAPCLAASRGLHFRRVERRREALLLAVIARALPETRPADAGRAVTAFQLALRVLAQELVEEKVLRDDDVSFHAHHFGDVRNAARAVAQARSLDDHVDGGDDHLADGAGRQGVAAHCDHGFDAAHRLARRVGVQRAHRSVMAGIHRLQQIERFGSAHFADDDALGPHAQAVLDEIAHGDLAGAFEIGRPRLQAHDMRLLELKLGGVFAGDDAFVVIDIAGQTIEQGRLAGARAARDEDVAADPADDLENFGAGRRDRAEARQLLERQLVLFEFADGERGPVDRQRRRDDVDARAVLEAGVADRRGLVDAPADLTDDALANVHQLRIVAEAHIGQLYLAADFDEAPVRAVDHDVGDVVAG